jgi:uncharacterized protein
MTSHSAFPAYTSFAGHQRLASGSLQAIALATRHALDRDANASILIFDNRTGRSIDVDTRGPDEAIRARYPDTPAPAGASASASDDADAAPAARGRGRPKLGVIAREVTLLPRHWEWLATQPGGASVALRKMVDDARRKHGERDRARQQQERAYHFMSALAGDLPGFEEATRALFARDAARFDACIAGWPRDVREHAAWLASAVDADTAAPDA